jgi:hypothetical protein
MKGHLSRTQITGAPHKNNYKRTKTKNNSTYSRQKFYSLYHSSEHFSTEGCRPRLYWDQHGNPQEYIFKTPAFQVQLFLDSLALEDGIDRLPETSLTTNLRKGKVSFTPLWKPETFLTLYTFITRILLCT